MASYIALHDILGRQGEINSLESNRPMTIVCARPVPICCNPTHSGVETSTVTYHHIVQLMDPDTLEQFLRSPSVSM